MSEYKKLNKEQKAFIDKHIGHTMKHDWMGVFCVDCDKDVSQEALDLKLDWR